MLKTVAIVIVGLIAALLIYAVTRPDTFRVERTTRINAPPARIFPLVNDFHSWGSWSPYEKRDPAMKRTYSGAENGKGAVYEWDGNKDVGKGRMEIMETAPPNRVTIKLDFLQPFEGHNVAIFTMEPQGNATSVTWAMQGPNSFMGKVMSLFINLDTLIGNDFETGLANMKAVAEK